MAQHDGGSVYVDVLPRINAAQWGQEIKTRLDPTMERAGRSLGRTLGRSISEGAKAGFSARRIEEAVREATPRWEAAAARSGRKMGAEMARAAKAEFTAKARNFKATAQVDVRLSQASFNRAKEKLRELQSFNHVPILVILDEASYQRVKRRLENLGPFHVTINVDADTSAAMARLLAFRAEADRLFSRSVSINVGANTAAASSALMMLGLQMAALASIPLGATIAAGLGAIAGAATSAGLGIAGMAAVAVPGVSRIREALQAQKTAQNQVTGATQSGTAAVNTAAIAAGQAQLRAMQMAAAERQLSQAQRTARQAQADLNAARREGARALADMRNQVLDARLALRGDELAVLRAKQALDELNRSREDALAVQRAQLDLAEAQKNLKTVLADPKATKLQKEQARLAVEAAKEALRQAEQQRRARALERKEAQLAYEQAVLRLKQQRAAYRQLVEDERRAAKAGVEGTEQVRTAKEQLRNALEQVAGAQRNIRQQQIQDRIATLQQADAMRQASAASAGMSAATARLGTAMAKLSAPEKQLLRHFEAFRTTYRGWVKDLEPDVLPVLSGGLRLVSSQLNKFSPMIRSSSAAFRILESRAQSALDGPFWSRFIANMSIAAPRAILGLGVIAGRTFTGLAGVVQAFLPLMDQLLVKGARAADAFARWGMNLGASSGFMKFLDYVRTAGPQVVSTLAAVGNGFIDIARALAPLAALQLTVVRVLAEGLAALARNHPGLLQLAASIFLVSKAMRVLGFSALIAGLRGTSVAAGAAGGGLARFGAILRTVGGYMAGVTGAAVTTRAALLGLGKLGLVAATVIGVGFAMQRLQESQRGAVQSTSDLTRSMITLAESGKFTGAFLDQFKAGALSGKNSLQEFREAADAISNPSWNQRWIDHPAAKFFNVITAGTYNPPLEEAVRKFKALDATLVQMVQGGQTSLAAAAFAQMAAQLTKGGLSINQINQRFPLYTQLVGSSTYQTQLLTQKINEQNRALAANTHAFITDEQEVIDFNSAIANASGLLGANGRAFFGNSQQARDNRLAVLNAARVINSYSGDLVDNNRVTDANIKKLQGQKAQLVKLIQSFGVSKREAQKYADALINIPKRASTDLTVNAKGKFGMTGSPDLAGFLNDLGLPGIVNAGGGYIGGAGGPRADNHVTRISTGEMVINAPAVSRHFPLLAAINDDGNRGTVYKGRGYAGGGGTSLPGLPGLAAGGLFAKPSMSAGYHYSGVRDRAIEALADAVRGLKGGIGRMLAYGIGQTAISTTLITRALSGYGGNGGAAVRFAVAQLGEPYVWGATGPNTWDCSGLTQAAWRAAGVNIPRVTYDQINTGVPSSRATAAPGDLFFPHSGHVMMVVNRAGGDRALIHAPHTGDVVRYASWRSGGTLRRPTKMAGGGLVRGFARDSLGEFGWSNAEWTPLDRLWTRGSRWNPRARDRSTGAYGIPQALPPARMGSFGPDWRTNPYTQVRWGLGELHNLYGTPARAWAQAKKTGAYQSGTAHARRGLAWVGENGAELINLRGGERIEPHAESMRLLEVAQAVQRSPVTAADLGADAAGGTHLHAHFDGWTRASVQHEVRTAFYSLQIEQDQQQRIGRRR